MTTDEKLDKLFVLMQGMNTRMDSLEQGLNARMDGMEQGLNTRMDGLEQTMQKMYGEMHRGFDEVNAKLDQKADKQDVDRILSMLDRESKQHEIDEDERLALSAQVDRHEVRIEKLEQTAAAA